MAQIPSRQCYIALGANLPRATHTPIDTLDCAIKLLNCESFELSALSSWFQTPAYPEGSGPDFVNGVAEFRTGMAPRDILRHLHSVEAALGRERTERWSARVCDLDLIAIADLVLPDTETQGRWRNISLERQMADAPGELILPHPRLQERSFVLVPLAEIAPDWQHPTLGQSVLEMLEGIGSDAVKSIRKIDGNHQS